jgi:hypothetical protein
MVRLKCSRRQQRFTASGHRRHSHRSRAAAFHPLGDNVDHLTPDVSALQVESVLG